MLPFSLLEPLTIYLLLLILGKICPCRRNITRELSKILMKMKSVIFHLTGAVLIKYKSKFFKEQRKHSKEEYGPDRTKFSDPDPERTGYESHRKDTVISTDINPNVVQILKTCLEYMGLNI